MSFNARLSASCTRRPAPPSVAAPEVPRSASTSLEATDAERSRLGPRTLEMATFLSYPYQVSLLRKLIRARRRNQVSDLFVRRAERFQAECGWCGKTIGEDEPVVAVGARVHDGIDLSLVEGKVLELRFEVAEKTILAGVASFDSPAKAEGKDIIFMACSDDCGHHLQAAFADELERGLTIQ